MAEEPAEASALSSEDIASKPYVSFDAAEVDAVRTRFDALRAGRPLLPAEDAAQIPEIAASPVVAALLLRFGSMGIDFAAPLPAGQDELSLEQTAVTVPAGTLGLQLAGGPGDRGCVVRGVVQSAGPAAAALNRAGVAAGMYLLEVDGEDVASRPHTAAVELLRARDGREKRLVFGPRRIREGVTWPVPAPGGLSLEDLCAFLSTMKAGAGPRTKVEFLYHLFAQKAGLDREGLGMLYATLLGDALSEEEIAAVVEGAARRIDADGDGEVSCNEFAQVIDEEDIEHALAIVL